MADSKVGHGARAPARSRRLGLASMADEVWAWLAALMGAAVAVGATLLLALFGLLGGASDAAAHPMPETRMWVDSMHTGVRLTLQIPLNRLEFAYGQPLAATPERVLPAQAEGLSRYLLQHIGARSRHLDSGTDGDLGGELGWQVLRPTLRVIGEAPFAELEAVLELRAPPKADARHFELLFDVVTHEVRTHRALVYLRNDWGAGQVNEAPLWLGGFDTETRRMQVDLGAPQAGASWQRLLAQGAHHIAEGTDHLLFLLTLLLVAPLAAHRRRWTLVRAPRAAVRQILWVVSAFTFGHSLTLALGAWGWIRLPYDLVEALVAASIIVAALHAWRPFMGSAGAAVAGGFGLLHGLAFASSLSGAGLTWWQLVQALLAFNLGIEAMQLVVVGVVMPPVLLLAQHAPAAYARLRVSGAILAGLAAGIWLMDRLGAQVAPLTSAVDRVADFAPAAAAALWLVALLAWWKDRHGGRKGQHRAMAL
ncbi:HupE / UreJ protein [Roseateles sp. YR242]|uniref:HupE/UreJ family protein n=1 Tax=Roseateles sp. YR242 TaxID=1855305 RepID=UPI0008D3AD60|nr:HupE/UreJ family protein [Roseateles sp. YR242]SEK99884.1 HupE / UreJ protein [Roseateles sp. YR242]